MASSGNQHVLCRLCRLTFVPYSFVARVKTLVDSYTRHHARTLTLSADIRACADNFPRKKILDSSTCFIIPAPNFVDGLNSARYRQTARFCYTLELIIKSQDITSSCGVFFAITLHVLSFDFCMAFRIFLPIGHTPSASIFTIVLLF